MGVDCAARDWRALHDDRDLATREMAFRSCQRKQLRQCAAICGFVSLGELTSYGCATLSSEHGNEIGVTFLDTMRCLEEDHRAQLRRELSESRTPLAGARRQKAFETETIRWQTCYHERGSNGGRPRDDTHLATCARS